MATAHPSACQRLPVTRRPASVDVLLLTGPPPPSQPRRLSPRAAVGTWVAQASGPRQTHVHWTMHSPGSSQQSGLGLAGPAGLTPHPLLAANTIPGTAAQPSPGRQRQAGGGVVPQMTTRPWLCVFWGIRKGRNHGAHHSCFWGRKARLLEWESQWSLFVSLVVGKLR